MGFGARARGHVFTGVVHAFFEHAGDGFIIEAVRRFHFDLRLHAAGLLAGRHGKQAVCIHLEGNSDACGARHHGRNAAQGEFGQAAAIAYQLALALHHVHGHGGLAVFKGGEILRARGGQRAVARNHFFGQAAVSFEAERERGDVEQQPFVIVFVAGEHIGLHGGTECHYLVGVEVVERGLAEKHGHGLLHMRHAGGTAHHNHAFDVGFAHAGIFERLLHRLDGFGHQMLGEVLKLLAGNVAADLAAV